MSVVSCTLLPEGRTFSRDDRGRYSYGATYRVETDDATDDQIAVQLGAESAGPDPLPQHMSVYNLGSIDPSAFCQSLDGAQDYGVNRKFWTFNVGWSPLPPGKSPLETQTSFDNPLDRPERFWSEFQTITEVIEEDYQGNPIVNGAGQPFDEPAEEESEYEVLVWEKNFATAGEIRTLNRAYRRKLNSDIFAGYDPKHCLFLPIRMSPPRYENGVTFYTGTFRIACSDRPWVREFVNRGFKHFDDVVPEGGGPAKKTLVLARDPVVNPTTKKVDSYAIVNEPVLLVSPDFGPEFQGYRLGEGVVGNVVKFQTRAEVAFSGLPITPPT